MMEADLSESDGRNKKKFQRTDPDDDEREAALPIEEERRSTGRVKFHIFSSYWKAVGLYVSPAILASLFLMQSSRNVSDWWLAHWVSQLQNSTSNFTITDPDKDPYGPAYFLGIYGALAVSNTVFTFFRAFLFAYGGLKASKSLHNHLIEAILRAKMIFFDTTPLGRILNRISSDICTIDGSLPFIINIFLAQIFGLFGTIIVTCVGIPWITLLLLPLGFIYFNLQHFYRATSRELKRLSTVTLSPIYSRFSETLSGLITIRSCDSSGRFAQENLDLVEDNVKTQFAGQAAAQWLNLRLQLIGVAMVTGVGIFAVVQHHLHTVDPGLVGLAISYALSVTGVLSGVVTSFVESEKEMVSVERVEDYIQRIPEEEKTTSTSRMLPVGWPNEGRIVFNRVSMKYREHFPLALQEVSLEILPAEKIGIVGRTGSGKSTLFQILFRLADVTCGDVFIDGVNINSISLSDLR